jgi:hypothetical protein
MLLPRHQVNDITDPLSTNSTVIEVLVTVLLRDIRWNNKQSASHRNSCYIYTGSACKPMPWTWRKCLFMFPIRLRTSEQIWHVVSPMCMAICNWQDFLWRNSLLQTPQRNAGIAATDDILLHQLPITGGNNHTLVAQANHTAIHYPINSSELQTCLCDT